MATTRDIADPRSPKRHAPTPAHEQSSAASRALAALDAAIWTSIVEFLPAPKQLKKSKKLNEWNTDTSQDEDAVAEVAATYTTVLNLRLVTKELAALFHPVESKALWRRLLLQSFDFSAEEQGFNLENFIEEFDFDNGEREDEEDESSGEQDDDDDDWRWKTPTREETDEENPQTVALLGRADDVPPEYLEEGLVEWSKLGIHYRPSQYGFLTTLQQQPTAFAWPETEDPFTLFGDLIRLLQLPDGGRMVGGGEGSDTTFKVLAAPVERGSSSAFYQFFVMKTLGYVPHFWHWGTGIGKEWKGFTNPDAFAASIRKQFPNEDIDGKKVIEARFDGDDEFAFPSSSTGDAKRLYRHIQGHCRDWRSVCCNSNCDGYTPVFFVGESKAFPHRWIGYAGPKCWT